MAKKKKNAKPPAVEDPPGDELEQVDYGTPRSSDDEHEEAKSADTTHEGQSFPRTTQESSPDVSSRAAQESSPGVSSASSSSSEEVTPLEDLSPADLALALWREETKAYIIALQERKTPAPLSAGSAEIAVTISHEAALVSSVGPVSSLSTSAVAVDTSLPSSTTADNRFDQASLPSTTDNTVSTNPTSVDRSDVQEMGGAIVSPPNPPLPSATQTNPSLDLSVNHPLLADVATVAVTAADLRGVPRLTGDSEQNVPEILRHFRVIVGLKAKRVRPNDEKFGDMVALEHVALLGEGLCLTLIQQLVTGQIDTSATTASTEPDVPGSHTPPATWQEMTRALLYLLMPANSIDECARQIAAFNQTGAETVGAYAMRYRTLLSQFQAAVDRVDDHRTPWNAMTVTLWQQGLKPNIRCLQLSDKPATSLKEAIDRARRHEATGLAGGHISALYHQVPHRALDRLASQPSAQNRSSSRGRGGGGHRGGAQGKRTNGRSPSNYRSPPSNQKHRVCTHPTCLSQKGHTVDHCWTRAREEREAASGASSSGGKAKKKKKKSKPNKPSSESDDDLE